jgi:DNA-binding XRE family transcriptional regulator
MNTKFIRAWIDANQPNGATKLAAKVEISGRTLGKILNEGHSPNLEIAKKLARVLEVSLDDLVLEAPSRRGRNPAA